MSNSHRGARAPILFCFCAPSASGKTTITREVVASDPSLLLSLSTTTRDPRPGELDGREYRFASEGQFQAEISAGEFLEHASYSGRRYGTGKDNIRRAAEKGADLVLDIDVQGAEQMRGLYGERLVVIFVFPPSFEVLKQRLLARGTEDLQKVAERLAAAEKEIEVLTRPGFSDYLLINDELPKAIHQAGQIVDVERLRCRHLDVAAIVRRSVV